MQCMCVWCGLSVMRYAMTYSVPTYSRGVVFMLVCTHASLYECRWAHNHHVHAKTYVSGQETTYGNIHKCLFQKPFPSCFVSFEPFTHICHSNDRAIHNDPKRFPQNPPMVRSHLGSSGPPNGHYRWEVDPQPTLYDQLSHDEM